MKNCSKCKKEKSFWNKLRLMSKQKIHNELQKCDLLCANCQRLRHAVALSG